MGRADEWETRFFGDLSQSGTGDFDSDGLPTDWEKLRTEALPIFKTLGVFEADLQLFDMSQL